MNKTWNPTTAADFTVLRSNVKNVLYATARSNAMNGCGEGGYYITYMAWWEVMIMWVDICLFVAAVIWGVFAVRVMVIRVKRERMSRLRFPPKIKPNKIKCRRAPTVQPAGAQNIFLNFDFIKVLSYLK